MWGWEFGEIWKWKSSWVFFDRKYGDRLGNKSWFFQGCKDLKEEYWKWCLLEGCLPNIDLFWCTVTPFLFLNFFFGCSDTVQSNERRTQKSRFSPSCRSAGPTKQPPFWPFSTTWLRYDSTKKDVHTCFNYLRYILVIREPYTSIKERHYNMDLLSSQSYTTIPKTCSQRPLITNLQMLGWSSQRCAEAAPGPSGAATCHLGQDAQDGRGSITADAGRVWWQPPTTSDGIFTYLDDGKFRSKAWADRRRSPQGVVLWTNIVNNDNIVIIFLVKKYLRLVCWKRECCHFNQCQRNDVADLRLKSPIFLPGWRSGCWKNWKSNFCTWCGWRNLKISRVSWVLTDFGACLVGVLAVAWFASIRF